jgi:phosphate transport system substrate-binding protein
MSRKMSTVELLTFTTQFGYEPTAIPVAMDAISLYVNKKNPISGLTLLEVDALFSHTDACATSKRQRRYAQSITRWSDLGVKNRLGSQNIQLLGRNSLSGTFSAFKKMALCGGQYKQQLIEQSGSAALVEAVSTSLNSIGYSGIGYKIDAVRIVPLSIKGKHYIYPSFEAIRSAEYPLVRYLYLYINQHPKKPLAKIEQEFIKFVLSQQGQRIVKQEGYVPLSVEMIKQTLLNLH